MPYLFTIGLNAHSKSGGIRIFYLHYGLTSHFTDSIDFVTAKNHSLISTYKPDIR